MKARQSNPPMREETEKLRPLWEVLDAIAARGRRLRLVRQVEGQGPETAENGNLQEREA